MNPQPLSVPVYDNTLAALQWQPQAQRQVIALHGWLDNAASFVRLAPMLEDCHVVALDLAGHGHSYHRQLPAAYNLWDDLLDILAAADHLGWRQFHLLGHSRGAMISLLLAAAMPERIQSLVLVDGLLPAPVTHTDTAAQLASFLNDSRQSRGRSPRGYESVEKAVEVRCRAVNMLEQCARPIVERALQLREGRYYWRSDARLQNASALKLTDQHNRALLEALQVPLLLAVSNRGVGGWDYFQGLCRDYDWLAPRQFTGSHHFHLEDEAQPLAASINAFFSDPGRAG